MTSYVPPSIDEPGTVFTNPVVIKKKTKKAFVPGYGVMRRDDESRDGDDSTRNTAQVDTPSVTEPLDLETRPEIVESVMEESVSEEAESIVEESIPEPVEVKEAEPSPQVDPQTEAQDEQFSEDSSSQNVIESLIHEIANLESRERELSERKSELLHALEALISQQGQLCEAENFEEAERIDQIVASRREELFLVSEELIVTIPERLAEVQSELTTHQRERLASAILKQSQNLERFNFDENSVRNSIQNLENRLELVLAVDVKYESEQAEIDSARESVETRTRSIQAEIEKESVSVAAEKQEAESRYEELDQLVQELQRQLAQAMEDRSECARTISACDLKLRNVKVTFRDRLDDISKDESVVADAFEDLTARKTADGGGDADALRKEISNLETEFACKARTYEETSKLLEQRVRDIELVESIRERIAKDESLFGIKAKRSEWFEALEYSRLLEEQLKTAEVNADGFRQRLTSLRERLPNLEAEKREAIANRDFKSAKELTTEISEILAEIDSADSRIVQLRSQVKSSRGELAAARQLESKILRELTEMESNEAEKEPQTIALDSISDELSLKILSRITLY
jgi:chromosome segregation ATPase